MYDLICLDCERTVQFDIPCSFMQIPEVFNRMLQSHTMQFTSITETSSKDVSPLSRYVLKSIYDCKFIL